MWLATLVSVAAVLAGALVALSGANERVLSPLRSFAVAAVVAAVVFQLLPEALGQGGGGVLAAFAIALVAPGVLSRLTAQRSDHDVHRDNHLLVELSYASLVFHKVTDGIGLGAALGGEHGHGHWDVAVAVAGHTVPMVAVVALTFRKVGLGVMLLRVAGLAVAMIVGAVVADVAARSQLLSAGPWLTAVAAGLILHVVAHDLPPLPVRAARDRVLELTAIAVGAGLPILLAGGHDHDLVSVAPVVADLLLGVAPYLAIGLVAAAAIEPLDGRGLTSMSARALGPETIALLLAFFGWRFALAYAVAALLPRLLVAAAPTPPAAWSGRRALSALDELFEHNAAWLLAGLSATALLALLSPPFSTEVTLALTVALAVGAAISAAAAALVLPVIFVGDLGIVCFVAAFLLGPLVATLVEAGPAPLARRALAGVIGLAATVGFVYLAAATGTLDSRPLLSHGHSLPAYLWGAALAAIAVRSLWRSGLAGWVAALHGHHEHGDDDEHGHEHGHGHGHQHEHRHVGQARGHHH